MILIPRLPIGRRLFCFYSHQGLDVFAQADQYTSPFIVSVQIFNKIQIESLLLCLGICFCFSCSVTLSLDIGS